MHRRDLSVASTQAYSHHHSVTTSVPRGNKKRFSCRKQLLLNKTDYRVHTFYNSRGGRAGKEIVIIPKLIFKAIETATPMLKVLTNNETKIPFAGTQYLLIQEQLTPPDPMGSSSSLSVVPGGHFGEICGQRSIQLATPPTIQMHCDEQSLVMNEELTGWASPLIKQPVSPNNEKEKKKS